MPNGLQVEKLSPFGIRVTNVDIRSDTHLAKLRSLLWAHGLILLPSGAAAPAAPALHEDDSLMALNALYGDLDRNHPIVPGNRAHDDAVLVLATGGDTGTKPDSFLAHADYSYNRIPASAATLCAKQLPPEGGGLTCFRSAHDMYMRLPLPLRRQLQGLEFEHSLRTGYERSGRAAEAAGVDEKVAVHPAIAKHPETGLPILFPNPMYCTKSPQLDAAESAHLLAKVFAAIDDVPAYKHKWALNDVLLWDNIGTQHWATTDYTSLRIMTGTTSNRCDFELHPFSDEYNGADVQ